MTIHDDVVTNQPSAVHLGHTVSENLQDDSESVYRKFYKQYNLFRTRFAGVPSVIKNKLFVSYCSSLYGIQICDLSRAEKIRTAWRKTLREVWHVPYRTHSRLLPALTDTLCSGHMLVKRFVKFACNVFQHKSDCIKFLFSTTAEDMNSVFSRNLKYVQNKCDIENVSLVQNSARCNEAMVLGACSLQCKTSETWANAKAVYELTMIRDGLMDSVLNKFEATQLLCDICIN